MAARVIIIGAGASGLATVAKLYENKYTDIVILEAEDRIGGRIHSAPFANVKIDLGAGWCHGEEDNIVYQHVRDLNLLGRSKCDYTYHQYYDYDKIKLNRDVTDGLTDIANEISNEEKGMAKYDGSFGAYFTDRYNEIVHGKHHDAKLANGFKDWFNMMTLCLTSAESWLDLSARAGLQYRECKGYKYWNWKDRGYAAYLDVLTRNIPKDNFDKMLNLNKEAVKIMWHHNGCKVICKDGTSFEGDHVVVTTSLGVLKARYEELFLPKLPQYKINAIKSLGFGLVNKILLRFSKKWWKDDDASFGFIWADKDRRNVANEFSSGPHIGERSWLEDINGFYLLDSEPNTMVAWSVGEFAKELEGVDESIIKRGCVFLLKKFLGDKYDIPEPVQVICTKWYNNPHFLGSYSYKSMATDKDQVNPNSLGQPLCDHGKPIVLFAGEATHPWYYSTVHGAVETGFREASNIINFYSNQ